MFLMVIFIVIETLSRYLARAPIVEAIELSEYALTWCTALALAFTQKIRGHIAVGFLEMRLSPRARGRVSAVLYPIYLAVVVFITWAIFRLMRVHLVEGVSSDVMHMPFFVPDLFLFIGFTLLCLQLIVDASKAINAAKTGAEFRLTKGEG